MSKFKAGDLALIIRSNISENLGKVVELVRATDEKMITLVDEGGGPQPREAEMLGGCGRRNGSHVKSKATRICHCPRSHSGKMLDAPARRLPARARTESGADPMNRFRVVVTASLFISWLLYMVIAFIGSVATWDANMLWIGNWGHFWRGFFAVLVVCIFVTAATEEAK